MSKAESAAEGLKTVSDNLNRQLQRVRNKSIAGLMAAGLLILNRSNKNAPREHGFLVSSGYSRKAQGDENAVEIGYNASYAAYVHESLDAKMRGEPRPSGLGVYWGPSGGPKFLERAINDSRRDVVRLVRDYAQVGGDR